MVDFRTTLRDVVENWGVPAMTHWNSSAGTGWEERAWWLACRRHIALGRLQRADQADKSLESLTASLSSLWVIATIGVSLPIIFLVRAQRLPRLQMNLWRPATKP
jgi:hypothetical protein